MPLTTQRVYNRISDPLDVSLMREMIKYEKNKNTQETHITDLLLSSHLFGTLLNNDNKCINICALLFVLFYYYFF